MLYPEVAVSLDDHLEDLMDVLSFLGQLAVHFQHLVYIELCDVVGIDLANVVHIVALVASRRFHSLDSEDLMAGALRCASHIIEPVIDFPPVFSALCLHVAFEVVWIDTFSVEKAENSFESLLSAAHVTLVEVISTNAIKVELAERVSHVARLDNSVLRVILSF